MLLMIFSLVVISLSLICGFLMLWHVPWADASPVKTESANYGSKTFQLSIIIPARNETRRLKPLLDSIAEQNYRSYELIVVDDQSDDGTGNMAAAAGAKVLRTNDLSDRWIGKSDACWTGAIAASGEWLLFLDADTRLESSDCLRRIAESFQKIGASGILSFQPYHMTRRLYESFSALFNIIVMAGMNVFTPWKGKFKSAGAFGPCLICNRSEYFRTGGHEAISEAIMDDLALGDLFMTNNLKVHCYGGRGLISFRMYPEGFGQLFEGWTKNFGTASQSTNPFVFALIIIWISGGYSTTALLLKAFLSGSAAWMITAGAAYIIYMLQLSWQARRTGNFSFLLLFFYPLLHIFFTVLFLWSIFLTKVLHIVSWRGRKIKGGLILFMRVIELPALWTIAIDFAAWFAIHMAAALFAFKLPDRFFSQDNWFYRCHAWENSGQIWQSIFKVKSWKSKLPDGASIMGKGFVKKNLQDNDPAFLLRFALESRRAEFTHWLAMIPAILFFLWNPVWVGFVMIIYAVFANTPCIIAQRYNRPRLLKTANRAKTRLMMTASSHPNKGLNQ